jgi:hypothetical protein
MSRDIRTGRTSVVRGAVMPFDLRRLFSRFLRRHRALRHFGRHPLLATLAGRGPVAPVPDATDRKSVV